MSEVQQNDDLPIAVRRKRRSSLGPALAKESLNVNAKGHGRGIHTPPSTPRRARKKVRFSDPGPAITENLSTGLTPSLQRSSINTQPSASTTPRRRQTTPASRRSRFENDTPLTGTLQFAPLRQVLEGRVKRRIQRNRLSEEVNRIDDKKRRKSKARQAELERLRKSLAEKDRDMQDLREAMEVANQIGDEQVLRARKEAHDDMVRELESEIDRLKDELHSHESQSTMQDWTQDPFDDDNDFGAHNYDDFDDGSVLHGTPESLRILSPPESAPDTPTRSYMQEGTQAAFEDLEKTSLYSQLSALQHEVEVLSSKLELKKTHHESLSAKLSPIVAADNLDIALDSVLEKLTQSQASAKHAAERFDALKAEISNLGFSNDTETTIANIATQFRQARIEMKHLIPGENSEGFENDKLLSMLIDRVRTLLDQVKTRDADIDQYHEQETLLRQQLGANSDALTALQDELARSKTQTSKLEEELKLSTEINGANIEVLTAIQEELAISKLQTSKLEDALIAIQQELTTAKTQTSRLEDELKSSAGANVDALTSLQEELASSKRQTLKLEEELKQSAISNVNTLTALQEEFAVSKTRTLRLEEELKLSTESNEKLKAALESYRIEVAGLERLIETMESSHNESEVQLRREMAQAIGCLESDLEDEKMRHESTKAEADANKNLLTEFETRLLAALEAGETMKSEMQEIEAAVFKLRSSTLEKDQVHGDVLNALALRNARVDELHEEVTRANASLVAAQQAISNLQTENKDLSTQVNSEQMRARAVVQTMRDQLMGAMNIGMGFLGEGSANSALDVENALSSIPNMPSTGRETMRFLESGRARKSGSKKRRYDSGLGFLEEEEDEMEERYELTV